VINIKDPFNKVRRSWSSSSESKSVSSDLRKVVFKKPAILKTENDSIEPNIDYVKMKGYMGFRTDETNFKVDSEGIVNFDN